MPLRWARSMISPRLLIAGMVASIAPDLDVAAFRFGIAYSHEFGHRGFITRWSSR